VLHRRYEHVWPRLFEYEFRALELEHLNTGSRVQALDLHATLDRAVFIVACSTTQEVRESGALDIGTQMLGGKRFWYL
jgi:hypothetical protein